MTASSRGQVKLDEMDAFSPQEPDEGYSEHPLYPSVDCNAAALAPNVRNAAELAAWIVPHLSTLSVEQKMQLTMALLDALPTTLLSEIVLMKVNPRLYIDFVEYLPTEICLKIFGYLDPVSLIHVAQSSKEWYNLALDRHLWEKLFHLEGWRAIPSEIIAAEERMNAGLVVSEIMHPQRVRSSEYGHVHKKRAISDPAPQDADQDDMDIDGDEKEEHRDVEMSGTSLFGGPKAVGSTSSSKSTSSVVQHLGHLMMESPSPVPEPSSRASSRTPVDVKGKGKAIADSNDSPHVSSIPKSALWSYDAKDKRYKINWPYLYTMRQRLEYNWEIGRFTNFQLPHPNHPEEGHQECIYSLQYNSKFLVSGSRDKTLRIWNMNTRRLVRPALRGHQGSVLCLQFDSDPEEDLIVSGSSDSDVILWKFSTGQAIQRLKKAHRESVLNVKFDKRILVTCSKDKTIKIFNRRPLRAGDMGYGDINTVSPVPINLNNFGYDDSPLNQLPIKPPYTQIGCLEGHGAAVNAVQICGREIVSASGDRHIKVWDWPHQICRRTFLGHNKGIACVQYDGRRIVSGSSDNEVKVFDRETGLEVASLRAHSNLVRTVQAGFGDLPYSAEEDRITAQAIDQEYFRARDSGNLEDTQSARGRSGNAGSRRPEDITAYGAKLPPGGGGGPYGRIVSGSYDQTIIIWRRDREGQWRSVITLRQEEGAAAAFRQNSASSAASVAIPRSSSPLPADDSSMLPSLHHNARPVARPAPSASAPPNLQVHQVPAYTQVEHPIHATVTPQTTTSYTQMIDTCVAQGPAALRSAIASFPTILSYQSHLQVAIAREPNPQTRAHFRQVMASALIRAQHAQSLIQDSVQHALATDQSTAQDFPQHMRSARVSSSSQASPSTLQSVPRPARASSSQVGTSTFQSTTRPPRPSSVQANASSSQGTSSTTEASLPQTNASIPQSEPRTASTSFSHTNTSTPQSPTRTTYTPPSQESSGMVHDPFHNFQVPLAAQPTQATSTQASLSTLGQHVLTRQLNPTATRHTIPVVTCTNDDVVTTPTTSLPLAATTAGPPTMVGPSQQTHEVLPAQIPVHTTAQPQQAIAAAASVPAQHHPHIAQADTNPARVFKLQFDARRIICCSQTSTIVGWDFCNGDAELEEASRFFAPIE